MFSKKTVVVLGGTVGIGRAVSDYLSKLGWVVVALGPDFEEEQDRRGPKSGASPGAEDRPDFREIEVDLLDVECFPDKFREAHRLIGPIDALVNAIDAVQPTSIEDFSPEDWNSTINLNLKAPFFASVAVAEFMTPGSAVILNFSSVRAKVASVCQSAYSAAKAGVAAATRDLAIDLGRRGIKVNSLRLPDVKESSGLSTPSLVDICETVAFLISDGATSSIDAFDYPLDDGVSILRDGSYREKAWNFAEFVGAATNAEVTGTEESPVAVVTGAARGLGKDLVQLLAKKGVRCALVDVIDEEGERAAADARTFADAEYFTCDISDCERIRETLASVVQRFGRIDMLFNSAAVTSRKRTPEITEQDWDRFMDIDLKGPYYTSLEAAKVMQRTGGGRIINFSSMLSTLAHGRHTLYGGAKEAMNSMTRSMAVALAPLNIQVFSVLPAYVMTPMTSFRLTDEEWLVRNYEQSLSKVLLYPEHVSEVFHHLAASETKASTGQKIYVDTGYLNVRHKLVAWEDPRESARRDMEQAATGANDE